MQGKIKKEYELLNIDFKNVIVLRLLGGNEFIYVPFDKKVEYIKDLKAKIDDESLKRVQKNQEFSMMDKQLTDLQLIYLQSILN